MYNTLLGGDEGEAAPECATLEPPDEDSIFSVLVSHKGRQFQHGMCSLACHTFKLLHAWTGIYDLLLCMPALTHTIHVCMLFGLADDVREMVMTGSNQSATSDELQNDVRGLISLVGTHMQLCEGPRGADEYLMADADIWSAQHPSGPPEEHSDCEWIVFLCDGVRHEIKINWDLLQSKVIESEEYSWFSYPVDIWIYKIIPQLIGSSLKLRWVPGG